MENTEQIDEMRRARIAFARMKRWELTSSTLDDIERIANRGMHGAHAASWRDIVESSREIRRLLESD